MPFLEGDWNHCYGLRRLKAAQEEMQKWKTKRPTWHQARLAARELRIHNHQHGTMITRTPKTIRQGLYLVAYNHFVRCAGLIGAKDWGDEGYELRSHLVFEKHRGQGVGTALFRDLLKELEKLRAQHLFLCTTEVTFYKRLGFVIGDPSLYSEKIRQDCADCQHGPLGPGFGTCPETVMEYDKDIFERDRYMID